VTSEPSVGSAAGGVFDSPWAVEREEARSSADRGFVPRLVEATSHETTIRPFGMPRQTLLGDEANPVLVEQFRRLAAALYQGQLATQFHSVMVTSASPGDGKTLTAVHLATVLSESYRRRVLLIDADLRRPSIAGLLNLGEGPGLSDALRSQAERKLPLIALTPTLTVLPAGSPVPDPIGTLTSPHMRRILQDASAQFDWVLLDTPPIGLLADASLLSSSVDRALFVIKAGQTRHDRIQTAIDAIGRQRILGIVLNNVERISTEGYYRYNRKPADDTSLRG
jgi:capsular exopolysaccharide synthesis family protein